MIISEDTPEIKLAYHANDIICVNIAEIPNSLCNVFLIQIATLNDIHNNYFYTFCPQFQ